MLGAIKQTVKGLEILREWFGAGAVPVSVILAESRAAICSTCPFNVKGNWLDRLKGEAAQAIKDRLTMKDGIGLTLSCESKLGFCEKCGCCLSLKAWVPIHHIMSHTPQNEMFSYPDFCWIRRELIAG